MKKTLLFIFLFTAFNSFSQNSDTLNRRILRPFGIGLNVLGVQSYGSISVDYFISHHLSTDLGLSPIPTVYGIYFNGKYHIGKRNWNGMPYIGLGHSWTIITNDDDGGWQFFYLPLGYHFVTKKGIDFGLESQIRLPLNKFNQFYGHFKIGYRFLSRKYR